MLGAALGGFRRLRLLLGLFGSLVFEALGLLDGEVFFDVLQKRFVSAAGVELVNELLQFTPAVQRINDRAEAQQALAEDNNEALHRGRKLQQFIDKFDPGSRNKALLQDIEKYLAVEKTKRLENQAAKQAKKKAQSVKAAKRRPKHFVDRIKVGSTVRLRNGGKERGEVIAMHKNAATVLFGAFKSKIELEKLSWVAN